MAAGFFYDRLVREEADEVVRVRSAGTWALEGQPASAYALQVMGEHGLDISSHRGRNLTQADVDDAALILTMSRRHADFITREMKGTAGKVYLLTEMAGETTDIADPYGGSLHEYRDTAAELKNLVERGYPRISQLLGH